MNVSSISNNSKSRVQAYIDYANSFMAFKSNNDDNTVTKPDTEPVKKADKSMGIETLTIFPKQLIDGHTVITA